MERKCKHCGRIASEHEWFNSSFCFCGYRFVRNETFEQEKAEYLRKKAMLRMQREEQKAKEAERKAKEEAERKAKEEVERKAKEEAMQKEREEIKRKQMEMIARAENGDSQIACQLGMWYQHGQNGFPKDDDKAMYWYQMAYMNGNQFALTFLNMMVKKKAEQEKKEECRVFVKFTWKFLDNFGNKSSSKHSYATINIEEYKSLLQGGSNAIANYINSNFDNPFLESVIDATMQKEEE